MLGFSMSVKIIKFVVLPVNNLPALVLLDCYITSSAVMSFKYLTRVAAAATAWHTKPSQGHRIGAVNLLSTSSILTVSFAI